MKVKEMTIEDSTGYKKLKQAILDDSDSGRDVDERMSKLKFAVERAKHYEEKTGVSAIKILDSWENERDYWYMNYYQDANQPLIQSETVKVFKTKEELKESIGTHGFRCPYCNGVSKNPYACDSQIRVKSLGSKKLKACDWKVYGLFGHLGKGIHVFVVSEAKGNDIFMPIAWEKR